MSETTKATMVVTRRFKDGKVLVKDEGEEEQIEIQVPADVALAEVSFDARMTINLGNFESVQLGVGLKLPCYVEEIEDTFKAAKDFVDIKLNKEVADLKEYKKGKAK